MSWKVESLGVGGVRKGKGRGEMGGGGGRAVDRERG